MTVTRIIGIDPGLVHTGVVGLRFDSQKRTLDIYEEVVIGSGLPSVLGAIVHIFVGYQVDHIFIEGYRPRSHFGTDKAMVEAVAELKKGLRDAKVLNNTGVTKIVTKDLLVLLKMWRWNTPTNHDDLRSAGRIALLGMMKDPELNTLLADVTAARLSHTRDDWDIQH